VIHVSLPQNFGLHTVGVWHGHCDILSEHAQGIVKGRAMKDWMKIIPEAELQTYKRAGFQTDLAVGARPVLVVVDVTFGFCGSRGATLDAAIDEYTTACGPAAWEAMPRIAGLIDLFRHKQLPVVYTRSDLAGTPFAGKATKSKRTGPVAPGFNDFPAEILPREGEWILEKTKASGFFQTPLSTYLTRLGTDMVVVCGVSTSGCVRATSVDAWSHGFTTFVVDDCCFDRSHFAHCANLFDLDAKYASVVSLHELRGLMDGPALAQAS
jgi:maleamate amidohydrolase